MTDSFEKILFQPKLTSRTPLNFEKPAITKTTYKQYVKSSRNFKSNTASPSLTVAIVAYNEGLDTIKLIDSLLALKNASLIEIILVDNGLDAATKQNLSDKPIHYIETTENLGPSMGRNIAAAHAQASLLAFLDADGVIDDSYITQCLKSMTNESVVCARGKVLPISTSGDIISSYDMGDSVFPCAPIAEGISVWRTKDFKKAGGFEDTLYGGEGIVLCYRMIELLGYSMESFIYYPKLTLHHDYTSGSQHLLKKFKRNLVNRWQIDLKYPLLERMLREYKKGYTDLIPTPTRPSEEFLRIDRQARQEFGVEIADYKQNNIRKHSSPERKKKYQFTVVIPCYNLGDYVEKAVNSILMQSLESIQVIVVDDVSPDANTQTVLKRLEHKVEVIYRKKNGGASAARNTGIKAASSDYILCLDADDTVSYTYLEEAYNVFEMDKTAGIVCSHLKQIGATSGTWYPTDKTGLTALALYSSPAPSASCFRKAAWKDAGGYDESMRGMEDWEFWISILEKGWLQRSIPRPHFIYLDRIGSKVETSNKNSFAIASYIATKHEKAYKDNVVAVVAYNTKNRKYIQTELRNTKFALVKQTQRTKQVENELHELQKQTGRLRRKMKKAARVAIKERDPVLFMKLITTNLRKIPKRIK